MNMARGLKGKVMPATDWQTDCNEPDVADSLLPDTKIQRHGRLQTVLQGGLSLADQVVVSAANFLTVVIISRYCTAEQMGVFALAWTLVNFLRTVQERMIATPYMVFVHHQDTHQPTFLANTLVQQIGLSLLASSGVIAMAGLAVWQGEPAFARVLAATACTIPLLMLRECTRSISFAHFRFASALGLDCIASITQILAIGIMAYFGNLSVAKASLAMGLACVVPSLIWLAHSYPDLSFVRTRLVDDWFRNWSYARWLLVARLLGMGGFLVMPWLVESMLSSADVGAFAVANSLVGVLLLFVTGMNNYFQPRTVSELRQHGKQAMCTVISYSSWFITSGLLLVSLILWLAGDQLLAAIYGQQYAQHGKLAFVLGLSIAAVSPSIMFGNGLAALERTKLQIWSEAAFFGMTITFGLWLIPQYKLNGAAISLVIGGLAASGLSGFILWSVIRHSASDRSSVTLRDCP